MSGTQRAIVELGGENYPLLLKDVESLSFDSLVDAIRKKVSPKEIPQSAVFACVDNTGRVVRIKDDEDVSYFLAVARLLEDKGRQAVLTVRIKTPGAPTPPPDLSAGPRARLREASNSPSPRGSPTPAYVPSYRDPGDEGGNIHFDPSSDRVVVLYDGHGEPEGEISPFTPHPPSPMKAEGHAGDEEGWEDEEEGGGEGKGDGAGRTTSDNAKDGAAQGTRGKGKGRRGGARADAPGQGHKDAAEPKKPQAGHDEKHAVAQPAPRPAKLSKIPEIIPDGENGWGGSGYDVGSP
ncbi:hypothetical protein DFJ74DRAFT_689701 [Hyaloraphidium curvatum]|nr:hypothetical protein DFJ74DRAFT_689701 [Hyaloraphidium curvatum]